MKAQIHTFRPVEAFLCSTRSWASLGLAVFRILILDFYLVMTWIFCHRATEVGRWPCFFTLSKGWGVGGSVSWLFVFLVLLLLGSLAHQHFLPQEPTDFQLFHSFLVVLSLLFCQFTFVQFHAFLSDQSNWFRSGSEVACPVCYHCCFPWRKLPLLCFIWLG